VGEERPLMTVRLQKPSVIRKSLRRDSDRRVRMYCKKLREETLGAGGMGNGNSYSAMFPVGLAWRSLEREILKKPLHLRPARASNLLKEGIARLRRNNKHLIRKFLERPSCFLSKADVRRLGAEGVWLEEGLKDSHRRHFHHEETKEKGKRCLFNGAKV